MLLPGHDDDDDDDGCKEDEVENDGVDDDGEKDDDDKGDNVDEIKRGGWVRSESGGGRDRDESDEVN